MKSNVCLGCGAAFVGAYCPGCEALAASLIATSHWPLETSLSPAALVEVQRAIEVHALTSGCTIDVLIELTNLSNYIRAHLQHVQAARNPKLEKDPLLL